MDFLKSQDASQDRPQDHENTTVVNTVEAINKRLFAWRL